MKRGVINPTINDVADLAGVSKRTVSRVINKSSRVSAETLMRVEDAIRQMNFVPNRQARALAARRSFLLGLIYDVPTLFVTEIQTSILEVCGECGFELVVHACNIDSEDLVEDVLGFVERTNVDGVILLPPAAEVDSLVVALDERNFHHVRFSSELSTRPWEQVVSNYLPAVLDMTSHLVDLGHRRFAFISGPRDSQSSQKRLEAYVQALNQNGLKLLETMNVEGDFSFESGVKAAEMLLSHRHRPTAIFAGNDEMAFGVMEFAYRMGIEIPRELSVVGLDGSVAANFINPSLSTIDRQTYKMAQLVTRKLISRIDNGRNSARRFETTVSSQCLPRESTGPVPER